MTDQQLIEQVATLCWRWGKIVLDAPVKNEITWWQIDSDDLTVAGLVIPVADYNPLVTTPEGRSQAIELAEKYAMCIQFCGASPDYPHVKFWMGRGFAVCLIVDGEWQRAICEAAVQIEKEKSNE